MQAGFDFFSTRRFFPLFGAQFMGAFNDNLLRTAVIVLISYYGLSLAGLPAEQLVNLATGIFILPYFLFSATAGKITECLDKAHIARWVKLAEMGIMLITSAGLFLHSAGLLLCALFLMGTHSTFFGPLKYSVLPQYLQQHELVSGNGLIEMGTFLAILLGQMVGSVMMHHGALMASAIIIATALIGYGFSLTMPPAPPTSKGLKLSFNVVADSQQLVKNAWQIKDVRSAILGISWFWLIGSVYTAQLPTFTRLHLGGSADVYTLLLAIFSIGIGIGSILCAKLSRGQLQLGLVLVGSLGMSAAGLDLALNNLSLYQGPLLSLMNFTAHGSNWHAIIAIALLGFFGGFFTVPLYTWLQTASPASFRSQAIAANNIVNGFYMVAAAIISALLLSWLHGIAPLFLIMSLANLLALGLLIRSAPILWKTRLDWLKR